MTDWPKLIRELMEEHDVSQRRVALIAKVNRSTFRNYLEGSSTFEIDRLERILTFFGYDIDIVQVSEPKPELFPPAVEKPAPKPAPLPVKPLPLPRKKTLIKLRCMQTRV